MKIVSFLRVKDLSCPDCILQKFVLRGYPTTTKHLVHRLSLHETIVQVKGDSVAIHIFCPDSTEC